MPKLDKSRLHRDRFHDFLNDYMGLHPSRTKLRSFAYVITVMIWLFFGIGPGQVLGNNFFGEPGAGYEAWILNMPSIWGYQVDLVDFWNRFNLVSRKPNGLINIAK